MGTLAQTDDRGNLIIYRTNIGDSKTSGVESYLEWSEDVTDLFNLTASSAVSYMHGIYTNASVRSGNENVSINGNKVESVPDWIIRSQVNFKWRTCALSILHSYTSSTFADPLNTVNANSTGSVGWVPEYHLFDLSISIELSKSLKLTANASNLFDKSYFTKRPQFYPGPGIWPSDGRTLSATISVQL
ncbi:MAG: TonB-dependent receptor [Saprospiraceae bacterium]|nr:TonB-dependent receptor [Saprospiraceae bacterium]